MRQCVLALAILLVPAAAHAKPLKRHVGGPGNDRVEGTAAADYLNGGPGDDVLAGGPNADYFEWYYDRRSSVAYGRDVILDFEPDVDRIVFEASLRDAYVCGFPDLDTDGNGV